MSAPGDGLEHTGLAGNRAVDQAAGEVDARGRRCPIPIIELARRIGDVEVGQLIRLLADDPAAAADVAAWCRMRGHELVSSTPRRAGASGATTGPARPDGDAYLIRRLH